MIGKFPIDKTIYKEKLIFEAIEDFSSVAKISFVGNILSIEAPDEKEVKDTFNEFMNYVISLN